jgi:hypothetical protein
VRQKAEVWRGQIPMRAERVLELQGQPEKELTL